MKGLQLRTMKIYFSKFKKQFEILKIFCGVHFFRKCRINGKIMLKIDLNFCQSGWGEVDGAKTGKNIPVHLDKSQAPNRISGYAYNIAKLWPCTPVAIVQYFSKITQAIINPFEQSITPQKINLRKVSLACIVREQKTPKFMK